MAKLSIQYSPIHEDNLLPLIQLATNGDELFTLSFVEKESEPVLYIPQQDLKKLLITDSIKIQHAFYDIDCKSKMPLTKEINKKSLVISKVAELRLRAALTCFNFDFLLSNYRIDPPQLRTLFQKDKWSFPEAAAILYDIQPQFIISGKLINSFKANPALPYEWQNV